MRKILFILLISIIIFSAYYYQNPILTSDEAILKAVEHLNDPPEEWGKWISKVDLNNLPSEAIIDTTLNGKRGFLNELTNRREWHVTITNGDQVPMVVLDAITGEFINLYGPMN